MAPGDGQPSSPGGSPNTAASWKSRLASAWGLGFLLALLTFAVYLGVSRNDFVNYDDSDYVTANPHVTSGLSWPNVVWAFRTGHASNWHPLTWISHMLDCQLFGQRPGPEHLVNLAFHAINSLLLLVVFSRLTGALWPSAFVAALFALHPLHVESVAWISERKDVLSTLFFLLTLDAYGRYTRAHDGSEKMPAPAPSVGDQQFGHCRFQYLLGLFWFALGLMSKPMLVTTPFVLLLLDLWPLGRLGRTGTSHTQATEPKSAGAAAPTPHTTFSLDRLSPLLLEKVPFLALSAVSCVITFEVQKHGGAVSTSISLGARVANALVAYVRYMGKMIWPTDLSVLYPHPGHWPALQVIASTAVLLAVSAVVLAQASRRPYWLVGWLWFLGTLIPVIGLVQVGIQSMADRYTYVPVIGLFVMITWGLADSLPQRPWTVPTLSAGAACALTACAGLTIRQVGFWHDSEALFRRAVNVTKNNYLAYNNLGYFLSGKGKVAEAIEEYRRSLAINPAYEDALNNMGYALAAQKQVDQAIAYYEAALRVRPDQVEVHNNLGNALSEIGKIDEAIDHYRYVLSRNPDHADAHNNLGIALAMQGKLDEAVGHFREAIRCKPSYASAHSNLGNAMAVQHKLPEAIAEYTECLRLKPDDPQAHNNLGNALAEQGRVAEATAEYTEALRLKTDNPEAHFNLALALLRQNKRDEARVHLAEALRLKPDYAGARKELELLDRGARP